MGLRLKLTLGFGGLLAILLFLGMQSLSLLSHLGESIDVILRENYRSVIACQEMKESLERMDSGSLFALAGDPEQGRSLAALHGPRFEQALATELGTITLPGEGERARRIRDLYAGYRTTLQEVLDTDQPMAARREIYFGRLLPLFQQIKSSADEILQMNQESMVLANARARNVAKEARQRMVLLLVLGTALAAGFVLLLSRSILGPLRRLTQSAQEIERGNLDLVVPVRSKDELGQLASAFNAMAASLRELRRSDRAKLLRAQRTSQLAIDSLPDAVAVFSPEGEIELANRTADAVFGLRPGEPVPAEAAEWLRPLLAETARRGASPERRGHEAALQVFVDGQERFLRPDAVPILDSEGRLLGTTMILSDVTDLRRVEEMKSGFVSTVSHELRTPLTSLQMALHILLEERLGGLTQQQTELLVAARDDAERLRQILEDLLEIARTETGRRQLRIEAVSPRDLVEVSVAEIRPAFEEAGVALSVDIDPATPRVFADPARMRLVLSNLLQNALHHTPAGGSVTARAEPYEEHVRFSVADTGHGIAPEHLSQVFEKFFQVPGTEDLGGVGLGLSIARDIVQAHGGWMKAQSPEGEGATFLFTLNTDGEPADRVTPVKLPEREDRSDPSIISPTL